METIDTWKAKQRSESLFSLREGENPLLKFIEVGKANRIQTTDQARRITVLRSVGAFMGWDWAADFCDYIEDYQLTCGIPHNSKEMLMEAIQFERATAFEKGRSNVNLITSSGDGKK